jgi:hypothetical protein
MAGRLGSVVFHSPAVCIGFSSDASRPICRVAGLQQAKLSVEGPAGRNVQQCARRRAPRLATWVSTGDSATLTRATLESFEYHARRLGEPDAPKAYGRRRNKAPLAPTTSPTGFRRGGSPVGTPSGFEPARSQATPSLLEPAYYATFRGKRAYCRGVERLMRPNRGEWR